MIVYHNINLTLGEKQIFKDFNLKVEQGEKILLSAPSGSGKSTLVKLLLGFQKPDTGEITVSDRILTKHTCHEIRTKCSYVSQDVDLPQLPVKNLLQRIYEFRANAGLDYKDENVLRAFDTFHLEHGILSKNVKDLSGGERQRLGLVLCVLLDRPIWLLDEVTSGLDRDLKETVFDLVMNSNKTVVLISHDDIWDSNAVRKVRWT